VEQAREGNEGLHAGRVRALFLIAAVFDAEEYKVRRPVLAAQARAELGMTGLLVREAILDGAYEGTSSVLRCWRSSWRNSSWLNLSARPSRPSNRSSGSSDAWLPR